MTRVLGIDPGLQITGYGLVEVDAGRIDPCVVEAGVIRLDRKQSLEQRLVQLEAELAAVIESLDPQVLVVEKLYAHYRHPRTAILMGHARGVILWCAQRRGVRIAHLPSTEVKKAMTGYGHASKEQMQEAVRQQCGLRDVPKPPDLADAIAIAMTFARRVTLGIDG